ncbi:hypothetical protein [Syntrophomonas palmitatica]|uniref:hypothetical protein n=1 Tax=Syntrophomonas palmitatica TaxID=402877 RepID=UPI0006D11D4C|nr:hypothetical protein [Syntrophomonas palmitatica]
MRQYWQFDYYVGGRHKVRYFYGTEAAVNNRIKKYECESKELIVLNRSQAIYLKTEKKIHIIKL